MEYVNEPAAEAFASMRTESGVSLLALTEASPVLLVFLRHVRYRYLRMISDPFR